MLPDSTKFCPQNLEAEENTKQTQLMLTTTEMTVWDLIMIVHLTISILIANLNLLVANRKRFVDIVKNIR